MIPLVKRLEIRGHVRTVNARALDLVVGLRPCVIRVRELYLPVAEAGY